MAEPFNFWSAIVEAATGNVAGLAVRAGIAAFPPHWTQEFVARGDRINPFRSISGNHDLVRGVRISWIRAASFIFSDARKTLAGRADTPERRSQERFIADAEKKLDAIRSAAFRRDDAVGSTAIDDDVVAVVNGTPEFVRPTESADLATPVTTRFVATIAAVMDCTPQDVPPILGQIAAGGPGRSDNRSFGELVFADFAEMLKSPTRYPEAKEAFQIAMSGAIKSLGEACLDAMRGVDAKVDALIARLDGLEVVGGSDWRPYFEKLQAGIEDVRDKVVTGFTQSDAQQQQILANISWLMEQWGSFAADMAAGGRAPVERAEERTLTMIAEHLANRRYADAARAADGALARGPRHIEESTALRLLKAGADADAWGGSPSAAARRVRQYVIERSGNPDAFHLGLLGMVDEFEEQGKARALTSDIAIAVEIARLAAQEARNPGERLQMLVRLGVLLSELGGREGGHNALSESISTLEIAVQIADAMGDSYNRGVVWMNLGGVRRVLGERTGTEAMVLRSIDELRFAIQLFESVGEWGHWARANTNLGSALVALAKLRNDRRPLIEAIEAFERALNVYNPGTTPTEWGMSKSMLGRALDQLAQQGPDDAGRRERAQQAIAAHRDALAMTSRAADRLSWAGATTNLANAVGLLARIDRNVAGFREALALQEQALEEYTPDRAGFLWATGMVNAARSMQGIGIGSKDVEWLHRARETCVAGLDGFRRANDAAQVQWAERVLGGIEASIAAHGTVH